jgi:hypothetical protein
MRLPPVGHYHRGTKTEPEVAARAEAAAGGSRLSLEPRGYVLGQLTDKIAYDR